VSGGTEHTAIWPSDLAVLYTIVSLGEASLQDFAGLMPAIKGLIAGTWTPASLIPHAVFVWIGGPPFFRDR
jgi:hypothetical protein